MRTFSIASAPDDPDLVIATRLTGSAYKSHLASLPIGSTVEIEGPYGDLTLHEDATGPAVFLAGGIGITPFLSMIRAAEKRGFSRDLLLFYSNRTVEDSAFLAELTQTAEKHPRLRLVAAMTDTGAWQGELGPITRDMLARHIDDPENAVFYLSGPPAMVGAMETMLKEMDIHHHSIRSEFFDGYR